MSENKFTKRAIQYLPTEITPERAQVDANRLLKKLCWFTRHTIAQLMKWSADQATRAANEQIKNQTAIIEDQRRVINSLRHQLNNF